MAELQYYWNIAMWLIGAAVWTVGGLLALHMLAWKLVKEVVGWPTLIKVLRAYRKQGANHD